MKFYVDTIDEGVLLTISSSGHETVLALDVDDVEYVVAELLAAIN